MSVDPAVTAIQRALRQLPVSSAVGAELRPDAIELLRYPGLPQPYGSLASHQKLLEAVKELLETLVRARGDVDYSAVTLGELEQLGILQILPNGLVTSPLWNTLRQVPKIFTYAAYGGLLIDEPVAFSDLDATWQVLDIFDEITPSTPRGITVDLGTSSLAFDISGVYQATLTGTFEHNSLNSGRTTNLRFWDIDSGAPHGTPIVVATGRNAEATSFNYPVLLDIPPALVDHRARVEIGGGDTYTAVSFDVLQFSTFNVGEWRGAF